MGKADRRRRSGLTEQRSFRLPAEDAALLRESARAADTSEADLARRLIAEGLRIDAHPLIRFRQGGSGIRRPAPQGRRIYVYQVIETLKQSDNDVAATAEYLDMPERLVEACIRYYADFTEEIDAEARREAEYARREREQWERRQEILGASASR